jgi:hypothetical protein
MHAGCAVGVDGRLRSHGWQLAACIGRLRVAGTDGHVPKHGSPTSTHVCTRLCTSWQLAAAACEDVPRLGLGYTMPPRRRVAEHSTHRAHSRVQVAAALHIIKRHRFLL